MVPMNPGHSSEGKGREDFRIDAPKISVQRLSAWLCTGNPVLSQRGRISGGAKPPDRQVPVNDFPQKLAFGDY
jgi:hypothetical protein